MISTPSGSANGGQAPYQTGMSPGYFSTTLSLDLSGEPGILLPISELFLLLAELTPVHQVPPRFWLWCCSVRPSSCTRSCPSSCSETPAGPVSWAISM